MKLVREYIEECNLNIIEENGMNNLYIEGLTIAMEVVNGNSRKYKKKPTSEAVERHVLQGMKRGRCVGELTHPNANRASINMKEISHRFVDVKLEGNNYWTKSLVLDTPNGNIIKNLHKGGVQVGISSRGLAELSEENGVSVIEKYHVISLGDIVWDPSAPNAFVEGVLEGKEWIWDCGNLKELDISENIDNWKNRFKKVGKTDYDKVVLESFQSFFDTILPGKKL